MEFEGKAFMGESLTLSNSMIDSHCLTLITKSIWFIIVQDVVDGMQ